MSANNDRESCARSRSNLQTDLSEIDPDKPKEACGVFGVYGHEEAARLAYLGLYALQHRGEEGAGIVSSDGTNVYKHRGMGLVADVFKKSSSLTKLKGDIAVGHNRYSTAGSSSIGNVQPVLVNGKGGPLAVAHNGNLVNFVQLRAKLEYEGSLFSTTSDSELVLHLACRSKEQTVEDRIQEALMQIRGAFSLLFMNRNKIIAVRDPNGFRPLSLGIKGDAYVVASESCAFDIIAASYIRDLEPGEMIVIDEHGLTSYHPFSKTNYTYCIFEYIYFSRPDSKMLGSYVDKARRRLGECLSRESPVDADIVISVPDSSNTAALGFSHESGITFEIGLIRNHYVGRTFIHPTPAAREFKARIKYNPVGGVLNGKRVVIVEDSIVRGTTQKTLTGWIKKAGAKEVHVRVSSPPIRYPCFYGMDFPTKKELIAKNHSVEQIRDFIDVHTLAYLSLDGLLSSVPRGCGYCTACFSGEYPVEIEEDFDKFAYESDAELSADSAEEEPVETAPA